MTAVIGQFVIDQRPAGRLPPSRFAGTLAGSVITCAGSSAGGLVFTGVQDEGLIELAGHGGPRPDYAKIQRHAGGPMYFRLAESG
jgi:hypothetical protein